MAPASNQSKNEQATVIVGGGFVGLFAALHLRHKNYDRPVTVIDANPNFVFKPLMYEYLSGEMGDVEIMPRFGKLFQGSDITFVQGKVTNVDLNEKQVKLESGLEYNYENLVLSVGSTQAYFGTKGAEEHSFPMRDKEDTQRLQDHLRDCLQKALQTEDDEKRQQLLTVAIVGAGHSGIEMSTTLSDFLPTWYAKLGGQIREIRIVVIDMVDDILPGDADDVRETVLDAMKKRTVPIEVKLEASAKGVSPEGLEYQPKGADSTEMISAATVVWTAGIATNPLVKTLDLQDDERDKRGRPLVLPTLQLLNHPEVFAAGDCATVDGDPQPPIAQVAYQQGAGIAHNLLALAKGKTLEPVKVHLRGTLLKLGVRDGLADLFDKFQIKGKLGAMIRDATYIEMLPTPVRNFRATTEWLTEEIFERYRLPEPVSAEDRELLAAQREKS